jgi:hypothetical protein
MHCWQFESDFSDLIYVDRETIIVAGTDFDFTEQQPTRTIYVYCSAEALDPEIHMHLTVHGDIFMYICHIMWNIFICPIYSLKSIHGLEDPKRGDK